MVGVLAVVVVWVLASMMLECLVRVRVRVRVSPPQSGYSCRMSHMHG